MKFLSLTAIFLMLCSTVKCDPFCFDQAFEKWFNSTIDPLCLGSCINYAENGAICCSDDCLGRMCGYFRTNGYEMECYEPLQTVCLMNQFPIPCDYRVGFAQEFYQVEESATTVVVTIVSTGGTEEVAVRVTTQDRTAVAPDDYEAVILNVTFSPGEYIKNVSVPIVHDSTAESDETFRCVLNVLHPPNNDTVVLGPTFTTIIIKNSDNPSAANRVQIAVSISVTMFVVITICIVAILALLLFVRRRRRKKDEHNVQFCGNQASTRSSAYLGMNNQQSETLFELHPTKLIQSNRIRLLDSIGEGEFGMVYKAHLVKDIKGMPDTVAVKTLKHYYNAEESGKIIEEGLRMVDLEHPNVLGLLGVCVDAGPAPYLVMPFMGHGNLLSFLKKRRPELDISKDSDEEKVLEIEKRLLDMCLQISKGMEYLASHNLVHRDLAARNCMLDMNYVIKVADFGLTEDVYARSYFRQGKDEKVKLPVKWMAPESLHDGIFTERTDVWSFGVTCWETFNGGRNPYPGIDPFSLSQLLMVGKRMDKPTNAACSNEIYEIMLDCWQADPEERPLFSHLVVSIEAYLGKVGGYIDFGTLQ